MIKGVKTSGGFKNGVYSGLGWGLGFIFVAIAVSIIYVAFQSPLNHFYEKYTTGSSTSPSAVPVRREGEPTISVTDLRNDIIAYYNTFITILIALLGASAIIGYLHLRHISKEEAEHRAYEAVNRCFDLEKTHRMIDERIGSKVDEWINDKDTIPGRLTALEGQFEDIRQSSDLLSDIVIESEEG